MDARYSIFRGAGRYVLGTGSLSRLGLEAAGFGKKALVVIDPVSYRSRSGGPGDRFIERRRSDRRGVFRFSAGARTNRSRRRGGQGPRSGLRPGGRSRRRQRHDLAKAAAVLATNDGKAQDYVGVGPGAQARHGLDHDPTTAGTGSEVTWTAVFTRRADKAKGGINSPFLYPDLALLDPELTVTVPPEVTASTGLDALCHAVESYTSRKGPTP